MKKYNAVFGCESMGFYRKKDDARGSKHSLEERKFIKLKKTTKNTKIIITLSHIVGDNLFSFTFDIG